MFSSSEGCVCIFFLINNLYSVYCEIANILAKKKFENIPIVIIKDRFLLHVLLVSLQFVVVVVLFFFSLLIYT